MKGLQTPFDIGPRTRKAIAQVIDPVDAREHREDDTSDSLSIHHLSGLHIPFL
jgi:hypothetical protein